MSPRSLVLLASALAAVASVTSHAGAATIADGAYMEQSVNSCPGQSHCYLNYSKIPVGKTLILTDVSCIATADAGVVLTASRLRRTGSGDLTGTNSIPPVYTNSFPQNGSHVLQTRTLFIVQPGQSPLIGASYSAASSSNILDCTIAGVLKSTP
ncbi:hypothetical protein [Oharaeibacter diazotrophicus]|uniref:Secreted protein n=1 Tax=Oharaeibacter diazotrophicus TaxID=1920512 RepID=A0A4R6RDW3_9HYPH|nr:hypothetical protein [Oharaeibacter diazotrophicus]TDP84390.1 hypothetical protein EDD54_2997 [Oharaeibacter diazotrophicus]BBE73428.1 hypothetical protein OHA_1_03039 [Pleomorphomonas sp. SM30]GLS75219.1 hypothetical protein GCM10007904_05540 [Oharaeibacter diazotrophicus]